jgi:hypothetical protein
MPGRTEDGYKLLFAECLFVSFQRYPESQFRGSSEVPRSHGALLVEFSSPTTALLAVREGEGVWLGLIPYNHQCCVEVSWLSAGSSDDIPLSWSDTLASLHFLHGLRTRNNVFCPFVRFPMSRELMPCAGVTISVRGEEDIRIEFVTVAKFEAQTGKPAPPPMSPDDAYGGWLLP